jgi:hypothetical protein
LGLPQYCVRYEKEGEEELLANMLEIIEQWNEESFQVREKNLRQFIAENQRVWESIV